MKKENEKRFFKCLKETIGDKYIKDKVCKDDIFLSKKYTEYSFEDEVNKVYQIILTRFKCVYEDISAASLAHCIDGMIINHPTLHTRIVEYDEEQHFTTLRKDSIETMKSLFNLSFYNSYIEICNDKKYEVSVQNKLKSKKGYTKEVKGFPYENGRMAQRAYYDLLRDTAHLSKKNYNLSPLIRFSQYEFEQHFSLNFKQITDSNIIQYIQYKISKYGT